MPNERYIAGIQALADARGIPNPLQENDLWGAELRFWFGRQERLIEASTLNKGGRLLFEVIAREQGDLPSVARTRVDIDGPLRERAASTFGELWLDERDRAGERELLSAIRWADWVEFVWKTPEEKAGFYVQTKMDTDEEKRIELLLAHNHTIVAWFHTSMRIRGTLGLRSSEFRAHVDYLPDLTPQQYLVACAWAEGRRPKSLIDSDARA